MAHIKTIDRKLETKFSSFNLFMLLASFFVLVSCSKGMESDTVINEKNTQPGTNPGPGDGGKQSADDEAKKNRLWDEIQKGLNGRVDGGDYDNLVTIQVDKASQSVIFRIPLPPLVLMPSFPEIAIPQLPGATVSYQADANGDYQFLVRIPVKYLVKGSTLGDYNRLPNGMSLSQFMPAGEIKGFAFELPQKQKYRLHFYFTVNAAAAFIEIPEIPEIPYLPQYLQFPIKNETKTQVLGTLGLFQRQSTYAAGVLMTTRISNDLAVAIDEVIKY